MYLILRTKEKIYITCVGKACYSNYDLNLSKQTFFDEKILAKQKGIKQMNIDRKLVKLRCDVATAVYKFIKNNIKCGLSKNYLTIILLLISSFPIQ